MLSLLDGHPNIACIPIELQFYRYWNNLNCSAILDPEELSEIICEKFRVSRLKKGEFHSLADDRQEWGNFNNDVFQSEVKRRITKYGANRRHALLAIHEAFFVALGKDIDDLKLILLDEDHTAKDHVSTFLQDYPNGRFIGLIRSPISSLISAKMVTLYKNDWLVHMKQNSIGATFAINNNFGILVDIFNAFVKLERELGKNRFLYLRYEDLLNDRKKTIKTLTAWLMIPFNSCLMECTILGKVFYPNSVYQKIKIKKDISFDKKYLLYSHCCERLVIGLVFYKHMRRFDYEFEEFQGKNALFLNVLGALAWFVPFRYEIGWMFNRTSRAFSEHIPSRPWVFWIYQAAPWLIKIIRRSFMLFIPILNIFIFLLQRIYIFISFLKGRYRLNT